MPVAHAATYSKYQWSVGQVEKSLDMGNFIESPKHNFMTKKKNIAGQKSMFGHPILHIHVL